VSTAIQLRDLTTDSRPFVLRDTEGGELDRATELRDANVLARTKHGQARVTVYKVTPEGEVAMSYSGPGGWMGPARRTQPTNYLLKVKT
jgi:hypothetical protein